MKSKLDLQQQRSGKVVKFGFTQFANPTPHVAKVVFRILLYISALWTVAAPALTEIPAETLAIINKYLVLGNALVNVTIKFWGWDVDDTV